MLAVSGKSCWLNLSHGCSLDYKIKYRNNETIKLCNFAVSIEDGEADFFAPLETANDFAPWGDQLGSLNPTHAQQHDSRFTDKITPIKITTLSFKSLIND